MSETLSVEMDQWLDERRMLSEATRGRRMPGAAVLAASDTEIAPPCPLTDAEIDWLWRKYQACSFPPATFAKCFARTPRENLTSRGKNACVKLAYKYRRQIFGKVAKKWGEVVFLREVRSAAARANTAT